jgi:elongation factor Ts
MTISIELIKELRQETGSGVLACREVLKECGGDLEKAAILLRERGMAAVAKRVDRETHNGVLDLYNHGEGRVGVMVEVNCETDFVARTEVFRNLAHDIALQIAANSPRWIQAVDVPEAVIEEERQKARRWALDDGKPENVIDRIADGRLKKFLDDNCLLRQTYIRDDKQTIEELLNETIVSTGENISIRRFERWTVGEELE